MRKAVATRLEAEWPHDLTGLYLYGDYRNSPQVFSPPTIQNPLDSKSVPLEVTLTRKVIRRRTGLLKGPDVIEMATAEVTRLIGRWMIARTGLHRTNATGFPYQGSVLGTSDESTPHDLWVLRLRDLDADSASLPEARKRLRSSNSASARTIKLHGTCLLHSPRAVRQL